MNLLILIYQSKRSLWIKKICIGKELWTPRDLDIYGEFNGILMGDSRIFIISKTFLFY